MYFASASRLSSAFGVVHRFATAHLVDRLLELRLGEAGGLQQLAQLAAVFERGEREQLAGDVLVAALLRELVGDVQQPRRGPARRAPRRACLRPSAGGRAARRARLCSLPRLTPALANSGLSAAALLVEQRQQQVRRLDHLVVAADGQRLGVGQGVLEAAGQFVVAHAALSWGRNRRWINGPVSAGLQVRPPAPPPATPSRDQQHLHDAGPRRPTRRCRPGIRSATATYSRLAADTPSA